MLVGVVVKVEVGIRVGVLVGVDVNVEVGMRVGVLVGVDVNVEVGMRVGVLVEVEDFPAFILVDDKGNDFFTLTARNDLKACENSENV